MGDITLNPPGSTIHLDELPDGRRRVRVELADPSVFSPRLSFDTTYPPELIEALLEIKGPAYLCDELARDEDPTCIEERLMKTLLSYVDEKDFCGKRILDFGCGSGASTMILARKFPETEIVGIELNARLLSGSEARLKHYKYPRVTLKLSPTGTELPEGIGTFDFIIMNAVFEHLLPDERRELMPKLWRMLNKDGILFIDETPNRIYHTEGHTTRLPLINYLPDSLAHAAVRRFSFRFRNQSWPTLLREGVRGGTESELLGLLAGESGHRPAILEPSHMGLNDRIDLQFSLYRRAQFATFKHRFLRGSLKIFKRITGITYLPVLSVALKKS